jgi:pyruvate kinase
MQALEPGARFLMDDGNVGMTVSDKGEGYFVAEVRYGQELSSRKGVNVPDLSRHVDALTPKDRDDLTFALSLGVDWIAQSFVQTGEDVKEARDIINGRAKLIAKIEKPAAVANFKDILPYIDAAMVARGDLGVEIPFEEVPGVQKYLISECRKAGKAVVVATQMLDSMRDNPRPTRAEVSDVAQAVYDGASGVMLSGETSIGKYPVLAVEAMDKICYTVEHGGNYTRGFDLPEIKPRVATEFNARAAANDTAPVPVAPPRKQPPAPGA